MSISEAVRRHVCADDAQAVLSEYLVERRYSGAWFESLGGRGDDPEVVNRFTPADIVAVSMLSTRIPGWTAIRLLDSYAEEVSEQLAKVPAGVALHEASDSDLEAVFSLQDTLDRIADIGHVTRSKLLARKRPHLVPVRDRHVLTALLGRPAGSLTRPLRDVLATDPSVVDRLQALRDTVGRPDLSLLRVLDIVVWMRRYGANSTR